MFKKILIANRGEIACRIIRTCKRLGIESIAVYSEADADALHVEMADEAIEIGPPPATESYLKGDRIIEAAKEAGAEAIHPGFGFLSEKADFVRAVEKAGLTFIGPGAKAIAAMGDKIESKKIAAEAEVHTVPGHIGTVDDVARAQEIAQEIGYPVMIKASAGGGGKGMRIAHDADGIAEGFQAARNEAESSFADARVFIEKFIEQPRHIEIQVLADADGNCIHLGERECSIQRRHQKVIEEAPSPFIDDETRAAMGAEAVALAKAVDYRSAGTVEFIVDKDKNFYFLEMNTRLQVEHPVTEMITGLDLVEEMIRIAAGEKLRYAQDDISFTGWAIEARIYAEDPYRGFLPAIGRVTRYLTPPESGELRIDSGIFEGSEISIYYDPMIAKLVTHGADRGEAIDRMSAALDAYYIRGLANNVPFLAAVMAHPRFREGRLSTAFIDEEYAEGFAGAPLTDVLAERFAAAALFMTAVERSRESLIEGRVEPVTPPQEGGWVVRLDGRDYTAAIRPDKEGATVVLDEKKIAVTSPWRPGDAIFTGTFDGASQAIEIDRRDLGYQLQAAGVSVAVIVLRPRAAELHALMPERAESDTSKQLLCPMPGLVLSIAVHEGDEVKAGQALAVIEAMKMENILRAERDGVVSAVNVATGDVLSVDDVILEFE